MDEPVRLGHRTVVVEFQTNRFGQDRIEMAYQRIEMLATSQVDVEDSVQDALSTPSETEAKLTEIHG